MRTTWLFVISLTGFSLSSAVVILFVPSLFDSGEQGSVRTVAVVACLAPAFAVGMLRWRPSSSAALGE